MRKQCLVLTRVLLHKPRLVVIDEALDPLDDDARNRVLRLLNDELKDAAIINIGRPETESHFFTRVLHLVKDPQGPVLPARSQSRLLIRRLINSTPISRTRFPSHLAVAPCNSLTRKKCFKLAVRWYLRFSSPLRSIRTLQCTFSKTDQ
jgi:energy-coupling factor transporter ATP-binding protein EcfA2